jgi:hypothetical protein
MDMGAGPDDGISLPGTAYSLRPVSRQLFGQRQKYFVYLCGQNQVIFRNSPSLVRPSLNSDPPPIQKN